MTARMPNGAATETAPESSAIATLPTPMQKRVRRAAEKIVSESRAPSPSPLPTELSGNDLDDMRRTYADWQGAAQNLQQLQALMQQATETELCCRGARNYVEARIRDRYQVTPQDAIDIETGAIRRGVVTSTQQ